VWAEEDGDPAGSQRILAKLIDFVRACRA
jgi:hypothetical protein